MTLDELLHSSGEWLCTGGPMADVVISTRIRLARNLASYPFLTKASPEQRSEISARLADAVKASSLGPRALYFELDHIDTIDRQVLVERHLISRQHANGQGARGVAISSRETYSIMVNEEDHVRMQVLRRGLNLDDAWEEATQVDQALEGLVDYAYHKQFGYLTACPTNVGTGLRVSVMLHLPALKLTNELEKVLRAAREMRLAVRGLYGEGTEALGDLFQVSNQITLGNTESEILSGFKTNVIPAIVKYEQEARQMLKRERPTALDDKVWRAWGLLENARAISSEEVLFLLSHLRMGVVMERIKNIDLAALNDLLISTQSAHLQKRYGQKLEGEKRSIIRADYIRERLQKYRPSNN